MMFLFAGHSDKPLKSLISMAHEGNHICLYRFSFIYAVNDLWEDAYICPIYTVNCTTGSAIYVMELTVMGWVSILGSAGDSILMNNSMQGASHLKKANADRCAGQKWKTCKAQKEYQEGLPAVQYHRVQITGRWQWNRKTAAYTTSSGMPSQYSLS